MRLVQHGKVTVLEPDYPEEESLESGVEDDAVEPPRMVLTPEEARDDRPKRTHQDFYVNPWRR